MKAFLLAAGHGTRLRPITDTLPKCLVPIRGTPLLSIWLELCKQFGIDEVLINIHAHAAIVRDFLQQNAYGIRAHVVEEEQEWFPKVRRKMSRSRLAGIGTELEAAKAEVARTPVSDGADGIGIG